MGRKKSKRRRPKAKKKVPAAVVRSSSSPPWTELPRDLTANILRRLQVQDILESAQKVCTAWWELCRDPSMWRFIHMKRRGCSVTYVNYLKMMCRHAVDLSQGQLLDIRLEGFANDDTLLYITQRSSHLKRLLLAFDYGISGKGLIEAVKKLPQLEELHIILISIRPQEIETIGLSCPMLKSFTLNNFSCTLLEREGTSNEWLVPSNNDIALAIAKNMPNLLYLQLFGNLMTNDGLQYILDGCPHLESLDLRYCYRIDLKGDLGKRCFQQIKDLRLPYYPVDDYEWDFGDLVPDLDFETLRF